MHDSNRPPGPAYIQQILSDIAANSGAEIASNKWCFEVHGTDNAVKKALKQISEINYVKNNRYHIKVKVELANDHKEFVSGKKNGKINKIMGQADVQILFEQFNEYDFYIDVIGSDFQATKHGLELVELELPASISFFVPDKYHKRIIGIGGQHIQQIMKKYSVFVKFSNAMDRDSRELEEVVLDNVICKTPARNAPSLELVKQEIISMVQQNDADYTEEKVFVPRLFHRVLMAHPDLLYSIEKVWSCKIRFPSTEAASDIVKVIGPEWQVPHAINQFLSHVPETHTLEILSTDRLNEVLTNPNFQSKVIDEISRNLSITVNVLPRPKRHSQSLSTEDVVQMQLIYTRDNRPERDLAIEHIRRYLASHGIDPEIKGAPSRPKSDSFRDSLHLFPTMVFPSTKDSSEEITPISTSTLTSEADHTPSVSIPDIPVKIHEPRPNTFGSSHQAWNSYNARSDKRASMSVEQQEQAVNELPDFLRQAGTLSSNPGDRNSMYVDSSADYDSNGSYFSRAVGTNPRSSLVGPPTPSSSMVNPKRASDMFTSQHSIWDQPKSRPGTGSSLGEAWANMRKQMPPNGVMEWKNIDKRKTWGPTSLMEKRQSSIYYQV